jgi:hypothetical protein
MPGYEVVTFKQLKDMGLPYSRSHLIRLEEAKMCPVSFKLHPSRGGKKVWWLHEWITWLKARAKSPV